MAPKACQIRDENTRAIIAAIDRLAAAMPPVLAVDNFTANGDGSNPTFTTAQERYAGTLALVRVGGVVQAETVDFTFVGDQLVFVVAPGNGVPVDATYYYAV